MFQNCFVESNCFQKAQQWIKEFWIRRQVSYGCRFSFVTSNEVLNAIQWNMTTASSLSTQFSKQWSQLLTWWARSPSSRGMVLSRLLSSSFKILVVKNGVHSFNVPLYLESVGWCLILGILHLWSRVMTLMKSCQAKQYQEDRIRKQLLPVIPSGELLVLLAHLIPWGACGGVQWAVLFGQWQSREVDSTDCWLADTKALARLVGRGCCEFVVA